MAGREGGHAGEKGRLGVGQEQDVAAPAEEKGGEEEPRSTAYGAVGGEERHQEGLGDGVPGIPSGRQGDEVGDRREAEADEQDASHAATVSSVGSGTRAGAQPGPRNTRPARSRQLRAALTSLMIATYSWVATLIGLNVLMFFVNP